MNLGLHTPLCSLTGYSEWGRGIFNALKQLNVSFTLSMTDQSLYDINQRLIPSSLMDDIKTMSKPITNDMVVINLGLPNQFSQIGKFCIGLVLFDTSRLSSDWLIALGSMDLLLTPSAYNKEILYKQGLSSDKIEVIPIAIDSDNFNPEVEPMYVDSIRSFSILYAGSISSKSNWDKLIVEVQTTFSNMRDVCLILKIPPPRTQEELVEIQKRVKLVKASTKGSTPVYINYDPVPTDLVPKVYQIVRKRLPNRNYFYLNEKSPNGVFISPSASDSIGMSILEAHASGLLTMGVQQSELSFMSDRNSINITSTNRFEIPDGSITKALIRAYSMTTKERETMESEAVLTAKQYSFDNCVKQILACIQKRI